MIELNKLAKEIHEANVVKGFWNDRNTIPIKIEAAIDRYSRSLFDAKEVEAIKKMINTQMLALIHSEISEALEADRKNLMDDKLPHRTGLEVELADALIRILDMASGLGLDIEGATKEKLEFNTERPYKHGKQY